MVSAAYTTKVSQLKKLFLKDAFVRDAETGYVVVKNFNITIDPKILMLASECWATYYQDEGPIDAIVGLPDAGSRLVPYLGNMLHVQYILPAKRTDKVPGAWENVITFSNYSFTMDTNLKSHIGFIKPGMRVLLVDDVVAHGTTAVAAIKAVQAAGAKVVGLAVLFNKSWQNGLKEIEDETRVKVCSLISIKEITKDKQVILE